MQSMNWQATATLTFLCVLCGCYSQKAHAQTPTQRELFTPTPNDQLVNATQEQSMRLDRIRHLPTTQSLRLVRINQDALRGNELRISIPGEGVFNLSKTGGEVRNEQDFTWIGTLQGEPQSSVTLIIQKGEVTGSIVSAAGLYRISPIGDGMHAVVKEDTRKFPPDEPPSSGQ